MKTKVFPCHPNSLNISHPTDGPLRADGSIWELDGFTCRMIADGAVTESPTKLEKALLEKTQPPRDTDNKL